MKRECVLVTGGAGFIGTHLVRRLLREPHLSLVVLDRLTYASRFDRLQSSLNEPRLAFIQGDVADCELGERLFRDFPITAVIHLAAESHVDRSIAAPDPFVWTNLVGTHRLAEVARRAWSRRQATGSDRVAGAQPRWIQVSTDEVFGSLAEPEEADEHRAFRPSSTYSASKAGADLLLEAAATTWGFPLIISRTCNNYGPGQHPEKFIPRMILAAVEGDALPIYGDGHQVREWLHVEDHCEGLTQVLLRGELGGRYHLGSADRHANLDVAERIRKGVAAWLTIRGRPVPSSRLSFVTDRPGHDRRYALDSRESWRRLDWKPQIDFEIGLERTIDEVLCEAES